MFACPALRGMVEYTAPHPETPACGNTQVNNVTPRCLRQEHNFTDQVGMHSADRYNPSQGSRMVSLYNFLVRNVKSSQLSQPPLHAQEAPLHPSASILPSAMLLRIASFFKFYVPLCMAFIVSHTYTNFSLPHSPASTWG